MTKLEDSGMKFFWICGIFNYPFITILSYIVSGNNIKVAALVNIIYVPIMILIFFVFFIILIKKVKDLRRIIFVYLFVIFENVIYIYI